MSKEKVSAIDISENEIKEIVFKANKSKSDFSKSQVDVFNCYEEINKIKIPSSENKIIYTDGMYQLKYENGEFFRVNTKDSTKGSEKLTRKEATDMYIEFFIKNRLNPLIARKQELNSIGINLKMKEKPKKENYSITKPRKLEDNDIII